MPVNGGTAQEIPRQNHISDPSLKPLDLAVIPQHLASRHGLEWWRSLEELVGSEEFLELLRREFPLKVQSGPTSKVAVNS